MKTEYPLAVPLDVKAQKFIQDSIETSYNIQNCNFYDKKIVLELLDDVSNKEFEKFIKNILYISSSINKEVLFENKINTTYSADPIQNLIKSNEVKRIAKGLFMFQGNFLNIFQNLVTTIIFQKVTTILNIFHKVNAH